MRGKTHIEAACLSLLGSTQPGRLAEYVRRATDGGSGDDGLIQRFGLLVWPDQDPEWRETDRYPNGEARAKAWETFARLDELDPTAVGAERDPFESLPFLRFDDPAQTEFAEWRGDLEKRLRGGDISPALESHLAKYRKIVPALALINHLADGGTGPIPGTSLARSLALVEYLETHARRARHSASIGSLAHEEPAIMSGQSNGGDAGAPSAAALRMRRHRERRRDGLRRMTIELRETEVTALIRKGFLNEDARNNLRSVMSAFYGFLDRTLDS
jgi:hypothetical protein